MFQASNIHSLRTIEKLGSIKKMLGHDLDAQA